jgi:hypothetical protein
MYPSSLPGHSTSNCSQWRAVRLNDVDAHGTTRSNTVKATAILRETAAAISNRDC